MTPPRPTRPERQLPPERARGAGAALVVGGALDFLIAFGTGRNVIGLAFGLAAIYLGMRAWGSRRFGTFQQGFAVAVTGLALMRWFTFQTPNNLLLLFLVAATGAYAAAAVTSLTGRRDVLPPEEPAAAAAAPGSADARRTVAEAVLVAGVDASRAPEGGRSLIAAWRDGIFGNAPGADADADAFAAWVNATPTEGAPPSPEAIRMMEDLVEGLEERDDLDEEARADLEETRRELERMKRDAAHGVTASAAPAPWPGLRAFPAAQGERVVVGTEVARVPLMGSTPFLAQVDRDEAARAVHATQRTLKSAGAGDPPVGLLLVLKGTANGGDA